MSHAHNFCGFHGQLPRSDPIESIARCRAILHKGLVCPAFIRDARKGGTRDFQALPRQCKGLCEMSDDLVLFLEFACCICCIGRSLFSF